jgi:hypothetical protein
MVYLQNLEPARSVFAQIGLLARTGFMLSVGKGDIVSPTRNMAPASKQKINTLPTAMEELGQFCFLGEFKNGEIPFWGNYDPEPA